MLQCRQNTSMHNTFQSTSSGIVHKV